ncbi:MAG TPA: cytochrome c [Dongiaceae bacterium]|nr:cytochrome c [Dongiaceae bacterium]
MMKTSLSRLRWLVLLGLPMAAGALADAPTLGGTAQARQVIAERKAIFTLTESNFKPVVAIVKGQASFDAAQVQQRVERLVFLANLLDEPWTPASNRGKPDTNALPEVWTDSDDFKSLLNEYRKNLQALATTVSTNPSDAAAFKKAAAAVAQNCKKCHDDFKAN